MSVAERVTRSLAVGPVDDHKRRRGYSLRLMPLRTRAQRRSQKVVITGGADAHSAAVRRGQRSLGVRQQGRTYQVILWRLLG